MSSADPLAHDDILLEFDATTDPAILTRRWAHSDSVDEPLGFEGYNASGGPGTGTERAMFADRQGSVIWVTEPATGDVLAAYEYDGYGQITQTQGILVQPYGYTGREYDAESGLYYYRARVYDPRNGVFLQSDPIGFNAGQLGLYSYVSDNPFSWNDPSGFSAATISQTAGGLVIGKTAVDIVGGAVLAGGAFAILKGLMIASYEIDLPEAYEGGEDEEDPEDREDRCYKTWENNEVGIQAAGNVCYISAKGAWGAQKANRIAECATAVRVAKELNFRLYNRCRGL